MSPGYDYFMCLSYPSPAPSMFAWRHGTPHGPAKLPRPTQTPQGKRFNDAFREWFDMPPEEKQVWARAEQTYLTKTHRISARCAYPNCECKPACVRR